MWYDLEPMGLLNLLRCSSCRTTHSASVAVGSPFNDDWDGTAYCPACCKVFMDAEQRGLGARYPDERATVSDYAAGL